MGRMDVEVVGARDHVCGVDHADRGVYVRYARRICAHWCSKRVVLIAAIVLITDH